MAGVPQASALVGRRVYSGSLPTLPHAIHRVSAGDCEAVCENDDSIGQMIADWLKPDWDDEDDFSPDTTSEEDIPSGTQGGIDAMPMAEQNVLARILVAVGGSDSSFSALKYALDLASAAKTSPTALIVQEILVTPESIFARGQELSRLVERLAAAAQRTADEAERRVRELVGRREMQIDIDRQTGRVGDCVVAAAVHASLLVLGRQGHYVTRIGLLGSNTESIVRRTHKPILVAPREHRDVRRVLVAYGGKDLGGLALTTGCDVAEVLGVPLEVLTVAQSPPEGGAVQEKAKRFLPCNGPAVTFSIKNGDSATAIIARCAADTLVVMGAYGHSRLYHIMLGSVTEQVVRLAQGPVLLSAKQGAAATD